MLTSLIFLAALAWLVLLGLARWGDALPRRWPFELLDAFFLYALLPLAGLLPAALILRSRVVIVLFLGAAGLFVYQFGALFTPRGSPPQTGASVIVLSYNIAAGNRDPDRLASLIRSEQPDVVVLQELTPGYAGALSVQLRDILPFTAPTDLRSTDGAGILSRTPLRDIQTTELSSDGYPLQRVRLMVGDRAVWLYNVHLLRPSLETRNPPGPVPTLLRRFGTDQRDRELSRLVAEVERAGGPFIVAGDFNTPAGSRAYRRLPPGWHDSFGERGRGFGHTWPAHWGLWGGRLEVSTPLLRIDYVWSGNGAVPARASVPWIDGSDHLPVLAQFRVGPNFP